MASVTITVSGVSTTHTVTTQQLAAIEKARAAAMSSLPPLKRLLEKRANEHQDVWESVPIAERADYIADAATYLKRIVEDHCSRTRQVPADVVARCLRSWSKLP